MTRRALFSREKIQVTVGNIESTDRRIGVEIGVDTARAAKFDTGGVRRKLFRYNNTVGSLGSYVAG